MMASRAGVPLLYVPLEAVVSKWYGEGEKNLSKVLNCTHTPHPRTHFFSLSGVKIIVFAPPAREWMINALIAQGV